MHLKITIIVVKALDGQPYPRPLSQALTQNLRLIGLMMILCLSVSLSVSLSLSLSLSLVLVSFQIVVGQHEKITERWLLTALTLCKVWLLADSI